MASQIGVKQFEFPVLPAEHADFIQYVNQHADIPMSELLQPYKQYDNELRKVFAQQPDHPAANRPNILPVFSGHEQDITIRSRNLNAESALEKELYIMPLAPENRKPHGSPAVVQSVDEFKTNFTIFSESSLADLDWSNVVVAGSAVVTSLLAVPKKHAGSKRALREYYHKILAPASDVDLFLYGMTEEQAIEKIKQIESNVKDALLVETTTIRTKNAITIVSEHPTRHIQIVLRIYKSISEILTGFDVDCSCGAYDGKQVWVNPRAMAAYMTQINTIDLTRRSPSYENRLSKYSHRGFEIYWPELNRSRIDPTIFERSFGRVDGLARLLVLEKLPRSDDRDAYMDQRRRERGRPAINRWARDAGKLRGNIKTDHEDEVAEWVDAEDVSDYHTFTIPYGPKFTARRIERLLYTKDILLNAEWNKPKDREVNLHRHPIFLGNVEDVIHDCCGSCPKPATTEEEEAADEESKIYVSGELTFIKDDPGRQAIGSFNPISPEDYTEMAYVGNTQGLCQAIVDMDFDYVQTWLEREGNDPNTRDYTGRTPLHMAVAQSSMEIVQCLIDHGARLTARLADGKTALHLAAIRGKTDMISALLRRSEANEEEEAAKVEARRKERMAAKKSQEDPIDDKAMPASDGEESDIDMVDDGDEDDNLDATTENSIVNIKKLSLDADHDLLAQDEKEQPDVYNIDVLAWDTAVSPLHLAIVQGHVQAVELLVQQFGADVLLPIKLYHEHNHSARAAILTIVLSSQLPFEEAEVMTQTLLLLGATSAQADMEQKTALHHCVATAPHMLDTLLSADYTNISRAINHPCSSRHFSLQAFRTPLLTAVEARDSISASRLLEAGARPSFTFEEVMKSCPSMSHSNSTSQHNRQQFETSLEQPVIVAVRGELPELAIALIQEHGADPNVMTKESWNCIHYEHTRNWLVGQTLLDLVRAKLAQLVKWRPSDQHDGPRPLEDDAVYLAGRDPGTYEWWTAKRQLKYGKQEYARAWAQHAQKVKELQAQKGVAEKQAAVYDMIAKFRELEALLVSRAVKTFSERYPDLKTSHNLYKHEHVPEEPNPFKIDIGFRLPDLTDESTKKYIELFDATWRGDLQKVKELTLLPWQDTDGNLRPPLKIAVQDQFNVSPLAIAMIQGAFDMARSIMDIAEAQYEPPDAPNQEHYRVAGPNDDDTEGPDDDSDMVLRLESNIIDDQFTIETIGEVSMQVHSRVRPMDMLLWECSILLFVDFELHRQPPYVESVQRTNTGSLKELKDAEDRSNLVQRVGMPQNLFNFALFSNNADLLSCLLDFAEKYNHPGKDLTRDSESKTNRFELSHANFVYAIGVDRPALLSDIIKRTGAGIPLSRFAEKSGIEETKKPKYYQGLSVRGKKRKDWAAAGRMATTSEVLDTQRPPLLEAAHLGAIETVEWFLSDAPLRCYNEFANSHRDDPRIQRLSKATGGFEASVEKFLATRSDLVLHACIAGEASASNTQLLKYLLKVMPGALEARTADGVTPLQLAFKLWKKLVAETLIQAGADQSSRDKAGSNIVHHLLLRTAEKNETIWELREMLNLVDKGLRSTLFTQRCSSYPGSLTPLAQAFDKRTLRARSLRVILEYSEGTELEAINGQGDTPLHTCIRDNAVGKARMLLDHQPQLVDRENASGRTPFEVMEDKAIAALCSDPPPTIGAARGGDGPAKLLLNFEPWLAKQPRYKWDLNRIDLVDRPSDHFIVSDGAFEQELSQGMWKLIKDVKERLGQSGRTKRKLVTLHEANEVARRLAQKERNAPRSAVEIGDDQANETSEENSDGMLQDWINQAVQINNNR